MSTSLSPGAAIGRPAARDHEMMGHPTGLFVLFGVEMWERFSYYGMRAILAYYLAAALTDANAGRGWSKADASTMMGWYSGMCYLTPVVGGALADRLIGTHLSMLIGGLIISLGHFVLFLSGVGGLAHNEMGMAVFVAGIALITLGTGHFKPSVSVMVSQLYDSKDRRRDSAFAIFYMGINVGAALGQFLCALFGEKIGWHWGFGCAAVGMLSGLMMYLFMRPVYLAGIGDAPRGGALGWSIILMFCSLALAALFGGLYYYNIVQQANTQVSLLFTHPDYGRLATYGSIGLVVALSAWFVAIQQPGERGPTACILIFTLFVAMFWMAFHQSDTSLAFFAREKTDRMIGGHEFPAGWFLSVNPVSVIVLSPLFAWFWLWLARTNGFISQPAKIAYGLILLGLGYIFAVLGAREAHLTAAKVSIFWLIATYVMFTVGELFLSPTGLSFVTKAAPVRFLSLLMGIWFISSFIANVGGGLMARWVEPIEKGTMGLPWYPWFRLGGEADYYLLFCLLSVGSGLLILILSPLLNRMLGDKARL